MSCLPSYDYQPTFTPGGDCVAPSYTTHRSRALIQPTGDGRKATQLFFRSVAQTSDANDIEVELTATMLRVYYRGVIIESHPVNPYTAGAIATLRQDLASSSVVEMPALNVDKYDQVRITEEDGDGTIPIGGTEAVGSLAPFPRTYLQGGIGAPSDSATLNTIRTGPTRTVYIVASEEDVFGEDTNPPSSRKIMQWNGDSWISYCVVEGECPGEGTC